VEVQASPFTSSITDVLTIWRQQRWRNQRFIRGGGCTYHFGVLCRHGVSVLDQSLELVVLSEGDDLQNRPIFGEDLQGRTHTGYIPAAGNLTTSKRTPSEHAHD
jgi:hypothetical protein